MSFLKSSIVLLALLSMVSCMKFRPKPQGNAEGYGTRNCPKGPDGKPKCN